MTDDIREAARQAAREAVAASYRDDGHHNAAYIVLMGRRDYDREVGFALAVADAALAAVAPLIRAQCAEVANDLADEYSALTGATAAAMCDGAEEARRRILALNEKEAP